MSAYLVQQCDKCGEERQLNLQRPFREQADDGGWRTLNTGSIEVTLCYNCVRQIVTAIVVIE